MFVITGGAGFIGSNVAAQIEAREMGEVAVIDRLRNGDKWRNISKRFCVTSYFRKIRLIFERACGQDRSRFAFRSDFFSDGKRC